MGYLEETLIFESNKLWINNFNTPDLGTAGSGDILAGLIVKHLIIFSKGNDSLW